MRQKSDIEPFEVCCGEGETLCNMFYEKRPLTTAASVAEFPLPCTCQRLAGGCRRGRSCRRRRPRRIWIRIRIGEGRTIRKVIWGRGSGHVRKKFVKYSSCTMSSPSPPQKIMHHGLLYLFRAKKIPCKRNSPEKIPSF